MNNLGEMGKFPEMYNFPGLNKDQTENITD